MDQLGGAMDVVVFGANGQTGRLLTRRALDKRHSVTAVTRNPDDFPFSDPLLRVVRANVREPSSLVEVVRDANAVVSTVGVPFSTRRIDTYSVGVRNIVGAMQTTGVRRLVLVSSTGAYHYPNRIDTPLSLRLFEPVITRSIGKTTYDDQRRMEDIVRASRLDWTVVRPSGLFDLPGPTNYVAGEVDPIGAFTARIDLADYMLAMAGDGSTTGKTVVISTVENTPTMWQMIRREAFKSA
jgi:uncharacterized protein YbjT (DUF2867 family)